jgi:hypothetical protein
MRLDKPYTSILQIWFEELQEFEKLHKEAVERLKQKTFLFIHRYHLTELPELLMDPAEKLSDAYIDIYFFISSLLVTSINWLIIDTVGLCLLSNRDCSTDILSLLLGLPLKLRRWYLRNCDSLFRSQVIEKTIGKEIVEVLSKARVELKIVLNADEVIQLIKRFGKEWKERAKKELKKLLVST